MWQHCTGSFDCTCLNPGSLPCGGLELHSCTPAPNKPDSVKIAWPRECAKHLPVKMVLSGTLWILGPPENKLSAAVAKHCNKLAGGLWQQLQADCSSQVVPFAFFPMHLCKAQKSLHQQSSHKCGAVLNLTNPNQVVIVPTTSLHSIVCQSTPASQSLRCLCTFLSQCLHTVNCCMSTPQSCAWHHCTVEDLHSVGWRRMRDTQLPPQQWTMPHEGVGDPWEPGDSCHMHH